MFSDVETFLHGQCGCYRSSCKCAEIKDVWHLYKDREAADPKHLKESLDAINGPLVKEFADFPQHAHDVVEDLFKGGVREERWQRLEKDLKPADRDVEGVRDGMIYFVQIQRSKYSIVEQL